MPLPALWLTDAGARAVAWLANLSSLDRAGLERWLDLLTPADRITLARSICLLKPKGDMSALPPSEDLHVVEAKFEGMPERHFRQLIPHELYAMRDVAVKTHAKKLADDAGLKTPELSHTAVANGARPLSWLWTSCFGAYLVLSIANLSDEPVSELDTWLHQLPPADVLGLAREVCAAESATWDEAMGATR